MINNKERIEILILRNVIKQYIMYNEIVQADIVEVKKLLRNKFKAISLKVFNYFLHFHHMLQSRRDKL